VATRGRAARTDRGRDPGRDQANRQIRLKQAGFPATKTLDSFDVAASSIPRPTFDYLASLEWIRATENLLLVGPAGTGKSHSLIGVGYRRLPERPVKATPAPTAAPTRAVPGGGAWSPGALLRRRRSG